MPKKPRPLKKIGRKRGVMGWMLLALGVLVAGVWGASGWFRLSIPTQGGWVWLGRGEVVVVNLGPVAEGSVFWETSGRWVWRPDYGGFGDDGLADSVTTDFGVLRGCRDQRYPELWMKTAALWPIPLLLWTPAALLLRSGILARRRALKGMCSKCGYSLAGIASNVPCPECGKASRPTAP